MDERSEVLGFEPQQETIYNKFVPYADVLDQESNEQLSEIKAQLGRTIQFRDIKVGASHWTGQLAKYIRLYGFKFSKEDHISLIKIVFDLLTIPDLDYTLVQKFASLLSSLLKKKHLLSREELVLPWRPLYTLLENVAYSRYEHHGLQLFPANIENVLKNLVRHCRAYFPPESTQEMLDEWRPLLCPFDVTMIKGCFYFDVFLPTILPPEHHDKGFKLWFDELISIWDSCQNFPSFETHLVSLFSRLANENIGYIDWDPWIQKIFTRILRSFNLPVGAGKVQVGLTNNQAYDVIITVRWISAMMGGGSSCQEHLTKMLNGLESFYHPSNIGKWHNKLAKYMVQLPKYVVRRIHRERYKKTWVSPIPESHKLKDSEITAFVDSMKPVVFLAMFSKLGSHDSAVAIDQLAQMRPERIIPPLLEKTYPAMETLTEPHRLIACLSCTVMVARTMLSSHQWYPEGRTHVIPLLFLSLPGIDPNDMKKCLTTFQLISTLASLVPLVDCSSAPSVRSDLTDTERELCAASSQFEDFVLQFMDKVFALIENSAQEHTRNDSMAMDRLNPEETMLEVGLLSTFNAIMQQSSVEIYELALKKLFRFVSTSILETRVSGRFASDLCRAAAKVHPERAVKMFVDHCCGVIINRTSSEDLSKEEHLDNELLWNMKLLSECVRCDGHCLLEHKDNIIAVLTATLHFKCKEGADLAGYMLRHTLKALTLIYTKDYRSSAEGWDMPLSEHLPIRDWGIPGDIHNLQLKWHVPDEEENKFAAELLERFLIGELDRLKSHREGAATLEREEIQQSLSVLVHCISGAGSALPLWPGEPIPLVESLVDLTRFHNTAGMGSCQITLERGHVREIVAQELRPLLDHFLVEKNEDDTKSLLQLIKVYGSLLFFHGTLKDDFDGRWKSLHIVKKSMENKFLGKKKHIRAVLVDRVQLQHELRTINRTAKNFTEKHRDLFHDLFRLSVSRYNDVRKTAQHVLGQGMLLYAYSYRALLSDILVRLENKPEVADHEFKGALYLVLGQQKRSLMTKRSWEIIAEVWPKIVTAQHSEKPSVLKLIDDIADKLHKNIEPTEIFIKVPDNVVESAARLWSCGQRPSKDMVTEAEMKIGLEHEQRRSDTNLKQYYEIVETLVNLVEGGTLRWKFSQLALEMLTLLARHDVQLPSSAVAVFAKRLVDDTLNVRKISLGVVGGILKQQKRSHATIDIDPYIDTPANRSDLCPGDRPDNRWHLFDDKTAPLTQEAWEKTTFVEKTHWGYYNWPRALKVYAPPEKQPKLGRTVDELSENEKPIYELFSQQQFVDKFISFLTLEENKGKDKFHHYHFTLFKGLFRNFDDAFVPLFRPHLERLVADTKHDTHECSHRCAAEIIGGLVRGSKHWTYDKVTAMWDWMVPVIRTALDNMTVETVSDWGTCFATASESRDPRKLVRLLETLMENPLRGNGGSFSDSSRLYVLQGSLAQQEWRIPTLLHRLTDHMRPMLDHTYKNVRDRIGSVLVNMYMYDVPNPLGRTTCNPRREDFLKEVLPRLEVLKQVTTTLDDATKTSSSTDPQKMETEETEEAAIQLEVMDTSAAMEEGKAAGGTSKSNVSSNNHKDEGDGENGERKAAIRLCKTVMKWMQGCIGRMLHCTPPDIFKMVPILCMLESEREDVEAKHEANVTLACMAQTSLEAHNVPDVLAVLKEVAECPSWHARATILVYIQVMVFCNLFMLQEDHVRSQIQELVLMLLCDEQIEVREAASQTLGGFLHCGYLKMGEQLMTQFEKLGSTKIKRKKMEALNPKKLIRRHAGVLGMSACVLAFPYDVPEFMPQVLMDLSDHLDDPQPIQMTVKKALSNFRRTHYDNWQDHKQKFTDDQLVVLTDLLVSPNYYA